MSLTIPSTIDVQQQTYHSNWEPRRGISARRDPDVEVQAFEIVISDHALRSRNHAFVAYSPQMGAAHLHGLAVWTRPRCQPWRTGWQ